MQFAYKTVARILGSTAMSTALLCPISAFADPYTATDGAAHRDASGTESTFSGNTVTAATSGPNKRAWGILVYENVSGEDTTVTVSDTTVTTTGDRAHGIQSGANGSSPTGEDLSRIVLGANVSVETTGNKSFGLHAVDGTSIEGAVMIETSGSEGLGALAETYSTITLTGGSITTTGAAAHGLRASNDVLGEVGGTIIATDVDISTAAAWTFGAYATDGSTITVNGGTITTAGERAYGLLADDDSTINSSAVITTSGLNAHGAQTSAQQDAGLTGGAIHFTGGSITTSGTAAYGLHAIGRGAIDGTVNVTTSGAYSFGAQAETNSTITLTGSQIKTSGANAAGLVANNDFAGTGGIITVTDTVIETTGATAPGAFVSAGGKIAITGGSISASGDDSPALAIFGTGTITLQDVTLTSVDAPTAYVQLTGATDLASLTFGAGTVATANNGTLVQVARTGNGADGTLQLTLADGSNTKGNIIDTDPKGTGKTLLTIGAAAQFEGRVDGVAGVTAQPGSTVDFAPGTNIAGDLTGDDTTFGFSPAGGTIGGDLNLNNGSSLSGGSLGGVPDAPNRPCPPRSRPRLKTLFPRQPT
ncbi:beta strand repeat-containing protein [Caenibius tardaugens]|uniref:beta strand repeat-containing protein n=1 Tax=Caenibius tardaugens TaxID=169176 RepID=UPI000F5F8828|nr:hypothetical protein [Caenibius tardaugens]AZI35646.1 hypothetical protein EGO55_06430 [Caenibius tardaugens NBRC 16725]